MFKVRTLSAALVALTVSGAATAKDRSVELHLLEMVKKHSITTVSSYNCMRAIQDELVGRASRYICFDKYSGILSEDQTDAINDAMRVAVHTVDSEVRDGYVYVRASSFGAETGDDILAAISASDLPVVLDLRGNRGGRLDSALKVALAFTDDADAVLYTERSKGELVEHTAHSVSERTGAKLGTVAGRPIAVLVDGRTASAAEILPETLRAIGAPVFIVGESTYGKAVAQKNIPFVDYKGRHRSLVLTALEYMAGKGVKIHHQGVRLDQSVEDSRDDQSDTATPEDRQFMAALSHFGG